MRFIESFANRGIRTTASKIVLMGLFLKNRLARVENKTSSWIAIIIISNL
jgi:hypothetical protein